MGSGQRKCVPDGNGLWPGECEDRIWRDTHVFQVVVLAFLYCSANQKDVNYAVTLEFFGEIIPEVSDGDVMHCRNACGLKMASALWFC